MAGGCALDFDQKGLPQKVGTKKTDVHCISYEETILIKAKYYCKYSSYPEVSI